MNGYNFIQVNNSFVLCFRVARNDFIKVSQEIVELFPGEQVETYYSPYFSQKTSGLRRPARGKLWSRYLNVRAAYRMANQKTIELKENLPEQTRLDVQQDIVFLKSAIEPYTKVLNAWDNTVKERQCLYKNCSVDDIFNDFPCLRTPFGLDLVSLLQKYHLYFNFKEKWFWFFKNKTLFHTNVY